MCMFAFMCLFQSLSVWLFVTNTRWYLCMYRHKHIDNHTAIHKCTHTYT